MTYQEKFNKMVPEFGMDWLLEQIPDEVKRNVVMCKERESKSDGAVAIRFGISRQAVHKRCGRKGSTPGLTTN